MVGVEPRRHWSIWISFATGVIAAALVIVLLLHTIRGPEDDTVWPLVWAIGLSAVASLVAAVPARRHHRMWPVAMEGAELALVALVILALVAVFYYAILGPGWS